MFVPTQQGSEVSIDGVVETLLHQHHLSGFDHREVKMKHDKCVVKGRWVLADPGMAEKFVKPVFESNGVVVFQQGAPKRFTEPAGSQKDRVVHSLQFGDVFGLVHKIAVLPNHGGIVGFGVKDSFFHMSPVWVEITWISANHLLFFIP